MANRHSWKSTTDCEVWSLSDTTILSGYRVNGVRKKGKRIKRAKNKICVLHAPLNIISQWPGSVVVERSPGMREVGGSIPGRCVRHILLLCLAPRLSIKELEIDWPARSQDNGMGWDITAYPWRGVSVGWHCKDWPRVGLAQDGSSTYTPHTNTTLFRDQAIELDKPSCSNRDKTVKLSTAT